MRIGLVYIALFLTSAILAQDESYADVSRIEGVDTTYKITAFAVERDNTKYIGTNKGLLRVSPDGILESLIAGKNITAVSTHTTLGVWAAIEPNVLYNPQTGQAISVGSGDGDVLITCMDFSGSMLWVGTNNGIYVVSVSNAEVVDHYTPENTKMESASVNTIYIEKSRLKWIGTDRGVVRIDNDKWKVYEKDRKITAITENIEGVWIASRDEMWLVDPYNRWTPCDVDDGLGAGSVRALASDSKGTLYILSDILVQFDPYNDEAIEIDYDYGNTAERAVLMVDMDEKLWIGSLETGLLSMNLEGSELSLSAYARVVHPGCPGSTDGSISITVEGGAPPYRISWENRLLEGNEAGSLAAGEYRIMVEDAESTKFPLKIELEDPQPMSASVDEVQEISQAGAEDGRISINIVGGTPPYSVKWQDGKSGMERGGLEAGTYAAVITDSRGCTFDVEHTLEEGAAVAVAEDNAVAEPAPQTTTAPPAKPIDAVDANALKTLSVSALAVGQTLRIEQLNFPADSTTITDDSYAVLDEVYRFLENNENVVIEIGGHTNGLPEHDYCDRLSTERARNVAEYLYGKGIPVDRIGYKGYGKRKPIATNSTVDGRRKNQRVEIKILSI